MIDAYTKAVLTVIALALVVLVVRPLVEPAQAIAYGPTEVKVVGWHVSVADSHAVNTSTPIPVQCVSGCR